MSPGHNIDFGVLIDRTIKDFQPVKRLWPLRIRLSLWILLESAILIMTEAFLGYPALPLAIDKSGFILCSGLPMLASITAAFLALRGAVPGREVTLGRAGVFGCGYRWHSCYSFRPVCRVVRL